MKPTLISILLLATFLWSCNKNNEPETTVYVDENFESILTDTATVTNKWKGNYQFADDDIQSQVVQLTAGWCPELGKIKTAVTIPSGEHELFLTFNYKLDDQYDRLGIALHDGKNHNYLANTLGFSNQDWQQVTIKGYVSFSESQDLTLEFTVGCTEVVDISATIDNIKLTSTPVD